MAIQWADDFSRYGLGANGRSAMLDGLPYAILAGSTEITASPDPLDTERTLRIGDELNLFGRECRIALPTVVSGTLGTCLRGWLNVLPASAIERPAIIGYQRADGEYVVYLLVEQNGALTVFGRVGGTLTQVATTTNPVIAPSGFFHYEFIHNKSTGEGEVRIDGIVRLTYSGVDTGDNLVFVNIANRSNNSLLPDNLYIKDLVIWDGTGSFNNSAMGTVKVGRLKPSETISLGDWANPFTSSSADKAVANLIPFNTVVIEASPSTSTAFQVGGVYYLFTTGSVDAGSPDGSASNPWRISRAATASENADRFFKAVNNSGTPGTTYSTALTAHPSLLAGSRFTTTFSLDTVAVLPKDGVSTSFAFSNVSGVTWANLGGLGTDPRRTQDGSYLSASDTATTPMSFEFDNLPDDVTSVRGLIMVSRHKKSDGGDANIQMALSPNGTDWDSGADRPITTAFQYDFDVSEASPDTALAWTPIEVNNLKGRIDRTV